MLSALKGTTDYYHALLYITYFPCNKHTASNQTVVSWNYAATPLPSPQKGILLRNLSPRLGMVQFLQGELELYPMLP